MGFQKKKIFRDRNVAAPRTCVVDNNRIASFFQMRNAIDDVRCSRGLDRTTYPQLVFHAVARRNIRNRRLSRSTPRGYIICFYFLI